MLVVINILAGTGHIDVLDTDDFKVERVEYDYASSLNLPIVGLTKEEGVSFNSFLGFLNNNHYHAPFRFKNFKVFWNLSNFEFEKFHFADMSKISEYLSVIGNLYQLGWFLLSVISLNSLDKECKGFYAVQNNKRFSLGENTIEVYTVMCLGYLYCLEHDVQCPSFDLFYEDKKVGLDIDWLYNCIHIFDYNGFTYFCDDDTVIKIRTNNLVNVFKLQKTMVTNTKHQVMKSGVELDVVSGDYIVKSCDSLIIRDDNRYIFSGKLQIKHLEIVNPDAEINVNNLTLEVEHFIFNGKPHICRAFNESMAIVPLEEYKINGEALDADFCLKITKAFENHARFDFKVTGGSSEDLYIFAQSFLGSNDLHSLKYNKLISHGLYFKLVLLSNIENLDFNYKPEDYSKVNTSVLYAKCTLDLDSSLDINAVKYFIGRDMYRYVIKRHQDSYYAQKYLEIQKAYDLVSPVSKRTGAPVKFGLENSYFYVDYLSKVFNCTVCIKSVDKFDILHSMELTATKVRGIIKEKYNYDLVLSFWDFKQIGISGFIQGDALVLPPKKLINAIVKKFEEKGFSVLVGDLYGSSGIDLIEAYDLKAINVISLDASNLPQFAVFDRVTIYDVTKMNCSELKECMDRLVDFCETNSTNLLCTKNQYSEIKDKTYLKIKE